MPNYVRGMVAVDIVPVYAQLEAMIRKAQAVNRVNPGAATAIEAELLVTLRTFNEGLRRTAISGAADAEAQMKRRLALTQKRPNSGVQPHLRNMLKARPLVLPGVPASISTGAVGVADRDLLDRKAIDPHYPQYGPYWMAQELGTLHQKGRVVRGFFYGAGFTGPTRPDPAQSGVHPLFLPGAAAGRAAAEVGSSSRGGKQGGGGALMTIGHEIEARHFIRDGRNIAYGKWKLEMTAACDRAAANIADINALVRGVGRVRGRRGRRR